MEGKDLGKVLYDNEWYRSNHKVSEVDQRFKKKWLRISIELIIVSVFLVVINEYFIIGDGKDIGHLLEKRIAIYSVIFSVFVIMPLLEVRAHFKRRRMPLIVTDQKIVFGHKKEEVGIDMVERVSFNRDYMVISMKDEAPLNSKYIPSEFIWNKEKLREVLSGPCQIEMKEETY